MFWVKKKSRNYGCGPILLLIITAFFISLIYKNYFQHVNQWITTSNGVKIFGLEKNNKNNYIWKGEIVGGCAHNDGILEIISEGKSSKKKVHALWGSINIKDWSPIGKDLFLGSLSSGKPEGFGVLRSGNKIYVGNFEKGKLNGYAKEYADNNLVYRGGFKDGMYNGYGALFKDGEFTAGNWIQGNLSDGYLSDKSNSVYRIWHRYFGKIDNKEKSKVLTKEEFAQLDKNEFQQYLAFLLDNYIKNKITETTENRTSFFSHHPIRMFWQTLFTPRNERTHYWIQAFTQNGLAKEDIEFFINSYINDFNKKNIKRVHIRNITLKNFDDKSIIDDKTFASLQDMEFAGWSQNFWIDDLLEIILLGPIIAFLFIIFPPSAAYTVPIKITMLIITAIIVIILSRIMEDYIPDFIDNTTSNYTSYLLDQNIFQKML